MNLILYEWTRDARRRVIVPSTEFPFKTSETFRREWKEIDRREVLGPFIRPIPKGHALFVAERAQHFPYHTTRVRVVENLFTPKENGVYFIARKDFAESL